MFQPQVWFLLRTYNAGEKRGSVIYKKVMEGKQPCRRIKGEKENEGTLPRTTVPRGVALSLFSTRDSFLASRPVSPVPFQ